MSSLITSSHIQFAKIVQLGFLFSLGASQLAFSDELDFIRQQSNSGSSPNVLIIVDGSSSLSEPYNLILALKDPATHPNDPVVKTLLDTKSSLIASLSHTDLIPPSMEIQTDKRHCLGDSTTIAEGIFSGCQGTVVRRWYLRKIDIARTMVRDLIPSFTGANVAVMRTSRNSQSFNDWKSDGNPTNVNIRTLYPEIGSSDNGAYVISAFTKIETDQDAKNISDKVEATYYMHEPKSHQHQSPVVESIYEAYHYFIGAQSPWTKTTTGDWDQEHIDAVDTAAYVGNNLNAAYKSPMNECSSNHIVFISDGRPTFDWHANSAIQNLTGGTVAPPLTGDNLSEDTIAEHTLLDELSAYLANTDLRTDIPGKQNIVTHFISTWKNFGSEETLDDPRDILNVAVAGSGGSHKSLEDFSELPAAMNELVGDINSLGKPAIGYKVTTSSKTGNPFEPNSNAFVNIWEYSGGRWLGNIKKYTTDVNGNILDSNNDPFIAANGSVNTNTTSLWAKTTDGGNTIDGGAASMLSQVGQNRYSIPNPTTIKNVALRNNAYELSLDNTTFNQALLNVQTPEQRNLALSWAAGMDVYDIDNDGDTTDVRTNLGDQLNNKPVVAHYGNNKSGNNTPNSVVFAGTNEGYLHAIDGTNGAHLYSFMPAEFLSQINSISKSTIEKTYGIDGQLSLWQQELPSTATTEPAKMLFFGLGNGGNGVYALDIKNKTAPRLAWALDNTVNGFERLGNAKGAPKVISIKRQNGSLQDIAIITGGLDPTIKGSKTGTHLGNAVYLVDAKTGSKIWTLSNKNATVNIAEMKYSIIGQPAVFDQNQNGLIDGFFINDIRGQIFRCDFFNQQSATAEIKCGLIAQSQDQSEKLLFLGTLDMAFIRGNDNARKIALSLTSGDRFNPSEKTDRNRVVVIYDQFPFSAPTSYKYDEGATLTLSSLSNASEVKTTTPLHGWYFTFPTAGEKSFSQTLIFDNKIFFSTHEPPEATANCGQGNLGTARVYALDLLHGESLPAITANKEKGLIWEGPARGLPDTPHITTISKGSSLEASVNLGVDNANLKVLINPVARTHWYQTQN